jgi:hypothetical protein
MPSSSPISRRAVAIAFGETPNSESKPFLGFCNAEFLPDFAEGRRHRFRQRL